jgi:hypothetical protein
MPATTNVNFRTVVHGKSNGLATFFPDVCKTPAPPAPPIPIPYPNIAQSSQMAQGSTQVKIDGGPVMLQGSNFSTSSGDEAGSAGGGVASNTIKGKAEFVNYSFDVMIQGKNVPRLGDMMLGNKQSSPNTPPMPEVQPPIVILPPMDTEQTEDIKLDKLEETDPEAAEHLESYGSDDRSHDSGGAPKNDGGPDTEEKEAVPTVKAKWGKASVTPPHPKPGAAKSPGFDDIPDDSKAALEIDTTDVPDNVPGYVSVIHAASGRTVSGKGLGKVKVKGNKVVDEATGTAPEWSLPNGEKPYDPWDAPFYAFQVKLEYEYLAAETPKDFKAKEAEMLRLDYWHACVSDAVADAGGLTTVPEMNEIGGILAGQPHHQTHNQSFVAADASDNLPALLGGALRNTYVYHHSSHGNVGLIALCHVRITDTEILDKKLFPQLPHYLAYLNCCLTGQEPDFSRALIRRGTRNVIAFKVSIPDNDARSMARQFYNSWCQVHKCDPAKIATVYSQVHPPFDGTMSPVLYGKDGESASSGPSALEIAAIAIGAIALGVLIGAAVAKLLK